MTAPTTITTTLGALAAAEPALQRLTTLKLDAKTRYHAVKLRQLVAAETKHFYEQRNELVREFGVERDPTPLERAKLGPDRILEVVPSTPKFAAFVARANELAAVPVVIVWGPVTSMMLEAYPDFTGDEMIALGPLCVLVDEAPAQEPTTKESATT